MAPGAGAQAAAAVNLVLLREARTDELQDLTAYVEKHGLPALCRVLINTNEFLFLN